MKSIAKKILFYTITTLFSLLLMAVGLKIIDMVIVYSDNGRLPDELAERTSMRTLEYYPYTMYHVQPYARETGKVLWTDYYDNFDVTSGDHGFFVDFDIDHPPSKPADEYRIILIGGSAAQGWGGCTNQDMFYVILEQALNQRLKAEKAGFHVKIINLAMGSSVTLQNFIALNKWGHKLDPDLILSFSGHNENAVPFNTYSDALGDTRGGVERSKRFSESRKALKRLGRYFPGLVKHTGIASFINTLNLGYHQTIWNLQYFLGHHDPGYRGHMTYPDMENRYQLMISTKHNTLYDVAVPLYVNALKSIKRDFLGIPMVVAFQPIRSGGKSDDDHYTVLINAAVMGLREYMNTDNHFLNLHHYWQAVKVNYETTMIDSAHLSNAGHAIATRELTGFLYPIITELRSRKNPYRHTS